MPAVAVRPLRSFVYTPCVLLDLELAVRFLRRRVGSLLRGTALAALVGVALATMALVVTLALMVGYRQAIASALQRGNAHLVGFSAGRLSSADAAELATRLAAVDEVTRTAPVTYLTALAENPDDPSLPLPVVVKAVATPPHFLKRDVWPATEGIPAAVGAGLARDLRLDKGDRQVLQIPPTAQTWTQPVLQLEVAEIFTLSFTEFDNKWIIVPLERVLDAMPGTEVAGVEIELTDPLLVDDVRQELEGLSPELVYTDWREMNRPMFAALRWQTLSLFVVLTLVVAVASFQVSSALVVLAIDKRRTAGMLKALGATPSRIWRILVLSGVMLGGCGVFLGLAAGVGVSWLMTATRAVRFPSHLAEVYLVDHVPFIVTGGHLVAVAFACGMLVLVASAWPALTSARHRPTEALRAV